MTTQRIRRSLLLALCATPWLAATAHAQNAPANYPDRPIKLIIPYTPSGLGDSFSRALAQHLTERLRQPVVVENRPGASQAIAAEAVAKAKPDGYTLFLGTQSGLVLNPLSRKELPFDPVRDFAPISMLYSTPVFLVVNPKVPANSVQELIALAKSQPGKLSYASIGHGTSAHLAGEMFSTMANIDLLHVPYKGGSPAIVDLLSGRVSMMFEGGVTALPYVRDGKLRVLASTGLKRSEEAVPNLPAMNEILPGYERASWFGLFAPAKVPRPIIDKLNREVTEIVRSPAMRKQFAGTGVEILPSTPEELGTRLRDDLQRYAKILRDAGIVVN